MFACSMKSMRVARGAVDCSVSIGRKWYSVAASITSVDLSSRAQCDSLPVYRPQQYNNTLTNSARFFSSKYAPNPLDAFRDPVDRQTRSNEPVGRSWSAKELRRKSYQDLHKLWYVLYKERNMLLTEQQLSRRRQLMFPQPERMYKVQKSMGAIKQVLGERKREKVAAHLASQMEQSMMAESQDQLEDVIEEEGEGNKN
ncbi:mitochondrial 39-S ribosomal protein L47 [Nitzschia inconspicua]|uniref:Mitochondrial 39-S ribosomal protein L47 n=1 Tax=Nitzschia inconspicua TaxID=303405 RepID=A0A9K3PU82_9STRA|nr:mitochondrial 39-S ribosomal protein L47 [Nitzschia inconspicua]